MSVQPPSKGWNILGAVFMSCGGLLLVALGGTCSFFLVTMAIDEKSGFGGMWPLLLLSLAILGGGITLVVLAIRLLREKPRC